MKTIDYTLYTIDKKGKKKNYDDYCRHVPIFKNNIYYRNVCIFVFKKMLIVDVWHTKGCKLMAIMLTHVM